MLTLQPDRLSLREFKTDDAPFILQLLNSPSWIRFIGNRNIHSLQDAENYLSEKIIPSYREHGFGLLLVETRNEQIPIGMCGLIKRATLDHVDIGFAYLPEYEGKGYAYEAGMAMMLHARTTLKLPRIIAITTEENLRSVTLLKKLGLTFEKKIRMEGDPDELLLFGWTKSGIQSRD